MAINTVATGNIRMSSGSGVSGSMVYNLWSSLYQPTSNCSYSLMFATRNTTSGERKASNMGGLSSSFSRTPSSLSLPNYGNVGVVNITANCAWTITYSSTDINKYFYISSSSVNASAILSGGYGGNGNLNLVRNDTPGTGSLTITIYYSNGAGGQLSTTVGLTW